MTKHSLPLVLLAIIALAATTMGLPLWAGAMLRERTVGEAEREIATQADIVAAATMRRLQGLGFALKGLPTWIDGPVLASEAVDHDVHEVLVRLTAAGGKSIGFVAIAPDGRLVATAIGVVTPGAMPNHLNRPNISGLGPVTVSGLAVSEPFPALAQHIRGRPVVAISRALPSGGWVQAIVPIDSGAGLLPMTDLGTGSATWLIRSDGQALATWPPPLPIPAPNLRGMPLFDHALAHADTGAVLGASPVSAGADVIAAYRSLPEFGLIVAVQRDRAAILAPWRAGMATTLAGLAIALLAVALLAWRVTRATMALTRSEDRATLAADALGLLLWSRPALSAVSTYHGNSAERLTGYTTEELTSRPGVWRERVVHPDDQPRVTAEIAAADLNAPLHQTYRIIRADGAVRWIEQRLRRAPGGGIVGVTQDITEMMRTQARLARSEAELAEALRISGLGRWRLELASGRLNLNDLIREQLGVDRETFEPTLANLRTLVLPEDWPTIEAAMAHVRETGETSEFEYRLRRPDGTVRERWARAAVERDGAGAPIAILGVCQDVTERREAAAQLAHASRMAALGQLTGGIAHDVNNMLTVVSLNLDLVADDVAPGSLAAEALDAARRAAAGGAALTAQLLAFARRQPLRPEVVTPSVLFDELRPMLARTLGQGVSIALTAAADARPVQADAAQLKSALVNLALNARDAMPDGGTITITAGPAEDAEHVAFAVADNGAGMPPAVAGRAFEPFFTTKPSGKGTGLGLSQVYGFVTQSHGTIGIESTPGEGTVVRFTLPVASDPTRRAVPRQVASPDAISLLVVEDEAPLRAALVAMCRSGGMVVAEAADAAEALALVEGGLAPDMLFTDINLGPGPDGIALATLLAARLPGLVVLLATGFAGEHSVPDSMRVLHKPYSREELFAAIAQARTEARPKAAE